MKIGFSSEEVKLQCTDIKAAKKLFGGDIALVHKLMARMQSLEAADNIKDIIVLRNLNFHKLEDIGKSKLKGYYAIDVKTHKDPWRIILRPMKEAGNPYENENIDEIADSVRCVEIYEVSRHYE